MRDRAGLSTRAGGFSSAVPRLDLLGVPAREQGHAPCPRSRLEVRAAYRARGPQRAGAAACRLARFGELGDLASVGVVATIADVGRVPLGHARLAWVDVYRPDPEHAARHPAYDRLMRVDAAGLPFAADLIPPVDAEGRDDIDAEPLLRAAGSHLADV